MHAVAASNERRGIRDGEAGAEGGVCRPGPPAGSGDRLADKELRADHEPVDQCRRGARQCKTGTGGRDISASGGSSAASACVSPSSSSGAVRRIPVPASPSQHPSPQRSRQRRDQVVVERLGEGMPARLRAVGRPVVGGIGDVPHGRVELGGPAGPGGRPPAPCS